jgi:hypothetical protein
MAEVICKYCRIIIIGIIMQALPLIMFYFSVVSFALTFKLRTSGL